MAAQFAKPYLKTNKNDAADAEAICEAVTRPNMRFVPIKNADQQAVLSLHRARQGFVRSRTPQASQIRGLLGEFGIVFAPGIRFVTKKLPEIVEDAENRLPPISRALFNRLLNHFSELDQQVDQLEQQIKSWHREDAQSQRLQSIPGIGPITASALVASIGNANSFKNGRQLAAWLGLVPRQHSSGARNPLLGISKRGDTYLRTLLVHGARAAMRRVDPAAGRTQEWIDRLAKRGHHNVAAVALANKNARIAWALLARDQIYRPHCSQVQAA